MAERRAAVADIIAQGLTPQVASAVSDDAVVAVYSDFEKAGIV